MAFLCPVRIKRNKKKKRKFTPILYSNTLDECSISIIIIQKNGGVFLFLSFFFALKSPELISNIFLQLWMTIL